MRRLSRAQSKVALLAFGFEVVLGSAALGWAAPTIADPTAEETHEQPSAEDLGRQLEELKAELAHMKAEFAASQAPPVPEPQERPESVFDKLRLWGYGEIYYTRPTTRPQDAQADLARAVFGIGYAFSDRTSFNSEYEVEHAVSSANDVGEFEVEQFYLDHQLAPWAVLRGGLFLMPFGLLNEHHEPTNFYGVQRNFVETLIIPSTWREGGFEFIGNADIGIVVDVGVTTGFDLSKWNFAPEFPPYHTALGLEDSDIAPLQATHQELALADAQHLSGHLALNYQGVPGLLLGGALFYGGAVKVPAPPNAPIPGDENVTLWEAHARWTGYGFDVSGLYARGTISDTAEANAENPGSPNPIPSAFYGFFAQAAYAKGWGSERYHVAPFARLERYDMGSSYQGTAGPSIPPGLVPLSATPGEYGYWPIGHDWVATGGANLYIDHNVVIKIDYQWFDTNSAFRRIDLGLGLSFD